MEEINLAEIWLGNLLLVGILGVLYVLLNRTYRLGFKALLTWSPKATVKLHDKYGQIATITATFSLGLFLVGCFITISRLALSVWLTINML